jgi:hypothetical protein
MAGRECVRLLAVPSEIPCLTLLLLAKVPRRFGVIRPKCHFKASILRRACFTASREVNRPSADGQHVMAYRFSADLSGEVLLPSKLRSRCRPAQHGALGWHARGSTYRLEGFAIGQAIANPVGRLGRVEAGPASPSGGGQCGQLDPLSVWWAVVVTVDRGFSDHRDTP